MSLHRGGRAAVVAGVLLLAGCGGHSAPGAASGTAPAASPAGDIPDTQTFVTYASAVGHYALQVPEGWAQKGVGADATFTSMLDGVGVSVTDAGTAPTVATARSDQAAALQKSGDGVTIKSIQAVQLPAGPAILLTYSSNSAPNPVTGQQVRLEDDRYLFFHNGKLASLTLWAPLGADNVDQWNKMAQSFGWR